MNKGIREWAAIGEIIASVGVITSLVFVSLELSEGNRETRATTTQLAVQSEMDMAMALLENADTWDKVLTGAPLSPGEETRRATILFQLLMLDTANRYQQYRSGYLDTEMWDGRVGILPSLVRLPIYDLWRNSPGGINQPAAFLELLDSQLQADDE